MRLEIEHVAPYLPYQLQVRTEVGETNIVSGLYNGGVTCEYRGDYDFDKIKPVLRPMSDLINAEFKQLWENYQCEKEEDNWVLEAISGGHRFCYADFQNITYRGMECLFANHFDIFGLIPAGSAIDINTL